MFDRIKDVMEVLENCPTGGVGKDGSTMEEMEKCWERGEAAEGDASYDVCQHAWRLLEKILEDIKVKGE